MKYKRLHLILAAGGSGKRMGLAVPKQFLLLQNKPIILLSAIRITLSVPIHRIIIVCPESHLEEAGSIFKGFPCSVNIIAGGTERFYSVRNATALLPDTPEEAVLVHDAVRPFVSDSTIHNVISVCETYGAAVPVVPLKESIRNIRIHPGRMADRNMFAAVQTPQCFACNILRNAYLNDYHTHFTDDASVVENAGYEVGITSGNTENIKITEPHDLILAQHFYEKFFQ